MHGMSVLTPPPTSESIYSRLGVRTIINAAGTLTRLGGTLMLPEVVEAMVEASTAFVKIDELQERAGAIIADITGAESGYVSSGAAAGLMLATAAAIAGCDPQRISCLPDTGGLANEVVVQRGHRTDYDHAVRSAGARLVEVGYPEETMGWELEGALGQGTAAVLHVANRSPRTLALRTVATIAHSREVPVIVDAAAALPPVSNLKRFISEGADLVVFSGGKALRGPQASGIVAGRADLVRAIALQQLDMDVREALWATSPFAGPEGRPFHGIGRSLKVGKEEIVGAITALQAYVAMDHDAELKRCYDCAVELREGLAGLEGVLAELEPEFNGRPQPVVRVKVDEPQLGKSATDIVLALESGCPSICVNDGPLAFGEFIVNPFSIQLGEAAIIIDRIRTLASTSHDRR